jgi:hypothetical protein
MSWSRSILEVDGLRRALEGHAHDGAEVHRVVDRELRGPLRKTALISQSFPT